MRDAKSFFSSDFESLLLEATRPTEDAPDPTAVERVVATVGTFVRNLDLRDATNPYRVTLRKLWAKLAEKDARTTLKALFLLHTLLASVEPEDGAPPRDDPEDGEGNLQAHALQVLRPGGHSRLRSGRRRRRRRRRRRDGQLYFRQRERGRRRPGFRRRLRRRAAGACTSSASDLGLPAAVPALRAAAGRVLHVVLRGDGLLCDGSPSARTRSGSSSRPRSCWGALAYGMDADGESEAALCCLDLLVRDAAVLFRFYDERLDWCLRRRAKLFADWTTRGRPRPRGLRAAPHFGPPLLQRFLRTSSQVLQLYGYAPPAMLTSGLAAGASGDDDDEDAEEDDEEGEDEGDGYDDDDGYEYDEEA